MVLFRYGTTGCHDVIKKAFSLSLFILFDRTHVIFEVVERKELIPVYPVASNTKFTSLDRSFSLFNLNYLRLASNIVKRSQRGDEGVFRDCILVPSGSPVRRVARLLALSMGVNVNSEGECTPISFLIYF